MIENQEMFLYASLIVWLILGLFKIIVVLILDNENRNEVLFLDYPIGINLYGNSKSETIKKARQFYLIISCFSIIFIVLNMFLYSGILKEIYYNNFVKLFFVFCFYFLFWIYFILSSFNESLGLWGFLSRISVVFIFMVYIKDSYSVLWIALMFALLGAPFLYYGVMGFLKLGASSGNPQARTQALNQFFVGSANALFMIFFALSPIIHSKFI